MALPCMSERVAKMCERIKIVLFEIALKRAKRKIKAANKAEERVFSVLKRVAGIDTAKTHTNCAMSDDLEDAIGNYLFCGGTDEQIIVNDVRNALKGRRKP